MECIVKLKTTGIDHVNLQVNDIEVSCKFWDELMGFTELEDAPEYKGKIIGNKQVKLALYENKNLKVNEIGFSHICFHIENFNEIEAKCKKMNLHLLYEGIVQWPHSRSFYINDPSGYKVEFSEVWGGGL
jgi:lactoylglutathione lyase